VEHGGQDGRDADSGQSLRPRCWWLDPVPVHALAVRGAARVRVSVPQPGGQVAVGEAQDDGFFFGEQRAGVQPAGERRQSPEGLRPRRSCRTGAGAPGDPWREVKDGREDRIQGGTLSGACPAGEWAACAASGRWLRGVPGRLQDGRWNDEMQQDSAGLDGT